MTYKSIVIFFLVGFFVLVGYSLFDINESSDLLYYLELEGYEIEFDFLQYHLFGYEKKILFSPFHLIQDDSSRLVVLLIFMTFLQSKVASTLSEVNGGIVRYDGLIVFLLFMAAPFLINTNLHLVRQNIAFYFVALFLFNKRKNGGWQLIIACLFHEAVIPILIGALIVRNKYFLLIGIVVLYGLMALYFTNSVYASFTERFTILTIHFAYLLILRTVLEVTRSTPLDDINDLQTT